MMDVEDFEIVSLRKLDAIYQKVVALKNNSYLVVHFGPLDEFRLHTTVEGVGLYPEFDANANPQDICMVIFDEVNGRFEIQQEPGYTLSRGLKFMLNDIRNYMNKKFVGEHRKTLWDEQTLLSYYAAAVTKAICNRRKCFMMHVYDADFDICSGFGYLNALHKVMRSDGESRTVGKGIRSAKSGPSTRPWHSSGHTSQLRTLKPLKLKE